jgi:hypothetical protein
MLTSTPSEILETIFGLSNCTMQRILPDKSTKIYTSGVKNARIFLLDPLSSLPLRQRMRYVENHLFITKN